MNAEAMTERFEMRLSQSILEEVDAWRARQSDVPSRSEAVRRLLETGLGFSSEEKQVRLLDGEKLILVMLCQLFKQLKLKSEIDPEFVEAVIHGGHYWALGWAYSGIYHGYEAKQQVLVEVIDVLDMWSFLESGYARLSESDKKHVEKEATPFGEDVVFMGFDGNGEAEHLGVAHFLMERLDRFVSLKHGDLNSHMPTLDTYRRMLAVFEPIRRTMTGRDLNAAEIIQVLGQMLHPEYRKPIAGTR